MPPDGSEMDSSLAYILLYIHRAALLKTMAYKNTNKAENREKKEFDEKERIKPRFPAGDYLFIEPLHRWHSLWIARLSKAILISYFTAQHHIRLSAFDPSNPRLTRTVSGTPYQAAD